MNDSGNLYEAIRNDFFRKVYSGEIEPEQLLVPERKQAEELSVSRGTVRKARQILVEEGFILNTQGSGAVYTPFCHRNRAGMDIVAVIVPVNNPFFMSYYRAFEKEAEKHDVLVVIKQLDNDNADRLKDVLFSLFMKGIRDVVFWPYDTILEYKYIERLCGLGMNVVFFDNVRPFGYCDYVSVDNNHAIRSLFDHLRKKGSRRIAYVGWGQTDLTSNEEREKAFLEVKSERDISLRVPWNKEKLSAAQLLEAIDIRELTGKGGVDGFLCGNGHIGIILRKTLRDSGLSGIPVCSMDNFDESRELGITVYEQPFEPMGKKTFQLLRHRHKGETGWQSETHYLKGKILER